MKKWLICILTIFISAFCLSSCWAVEDKNRLILSRGVYFVTESGERIGDGEIIECALTDDNVSYQLYWEIVPSNTSHKEVVFESSNPLVKVDAFGLVTFLDEVDAVITIRVMDGSGTLDRITLVPKIAFSK